MATVASSTYASSAQSVLKIFDYNLPYLEKIITVNPIIHWPHSITKILFFVFLFESEPVWGEEQHMEEQYKGSLRKGERLNKLQKDVFSYQFKCQPCLSYLLLGASIVMWIQSVFHTLTHSTHPHTHTHIYTPFIGVVNFSLNTVDDSLCSLKGHCAIVVGSRSS